MWRPRRRLTHCGYSPPWICWRGATKKEGAHLRRQRRLFMEEEARLRGGGAKIAFDTLRVPPRRALRRHHPDMGRDNMPFMLILRPLMALLSGRWCLHGRGGVQALGYPAAPLVSLACHVIRRLQRRGATDFCPPRAHKWERPCHVIQRRGASLPEGVH
jgi:hypothetical protein